MRWFGLMVVWVSTLRAQPPSEIHIGLPALERLLSAQQFTDDGRRYVRGNRAQKCDFAYLENPRMQARDNRLAIQTRFTGRTALDVFGKCVGLNDAFDLVITGTPYVDKGVVRLKDLDVNANKDSFYIRRVKNALRQSLPQQFQYPVWQDAKRMLEARNPNDPFERELKRFDVLNITAHDNVLTLLVTFALLLK
jgi:hypothetical protein